MVRMNVFTGSNYIFWVEGERGVWMDESHSSMFVSLYPYFSPTAMNVPRSREARFVGPTRMMLTIWSGLVWSREWTKASEADEEEKVCVGAVGFRGHWFGCQCSL